MARYYFNLQSFRDHVGAELPTIAAAKRYALRFAGELIRDLDVADWGKDYWRMDVRQSADRPVFSLIVELVPAKQPAADLASITPREGHDEMVATTAPAAPHRKADGLPAAGRV